MRRTTCLDGYELRSHAVYVGASSEGRRVVQAQMPENITYSCPKIVNSSNNFNLGGTGHLENKTFLVQRNGSIFEVERTDRKGEGWSEELIFECLPISVEGIFDPFFMCSPCVSGRFRPPSQSSLARCGNCPTGRFAERYQRTECQECPRGIFQLRPGRSPANPAQQDQPVRSLAQQHVLLCSNGAYSIPASIRCDFSNSSCPAGHFAEPPNRCSRCKAGTFSSKPGMYGAESCTKCPDGFFRSAAKWSDPRRCRHCPAGWLTSEAGASSCTVCPAGLYMGTVGEGKSACSLCPAGFFSPPGRTENLRSCAQCPKGWFAGGVGASSCLVCPAGYRARDKILEVGSGGDDSGRSLWIRDGASLVTSLTSALLS